MVTVRPAPREDVREDPKEDYQYAPPSELNIPQEVKDRFKADGFELKFIRVTIRGDEDYRNVGSKLQEGWIFVNPEEVPELTGMVEILRGGRWPNIVVVGDLALAKCPSHKVEAKSRFYEDLAAQQMQGVRETLKRFDVRMPLVDDSKSSVGTGRNAHFQQ